MGPMRKMVLPFEGLLQLLPVHRRTLILLPAVEGHSVLAFGQATSGVFGLLPNYCVSLHLPLKPGRN